MQNNKKLNFSFLYFLILIPFFKTDFLARFQLVSTLFNFLKILSIGFIILTVCKRKYLSKKMLLLFAFGLTIIIPTVLYNGDKAAMLNYFISFWCLSYLVDTLNQKEKFLGTLLFIFEIFIYINFITMLFYPSGMYSTGTISNGIAYQNWFLGFKNILVCYFLPAYIISYLYMNITGNKTRTFFLTIVIFVSTLISGSTTTLVGITILLLFSVFSFLQKQYKIFNFKNYFITIIILFFCIVICRFQNLFEFLIVDILNKDLTFTNRTELWDITLDAIANKPIIGHGWESTDLRHLMYNSSTIITAHNQILEYMYLGGIIAITVLFIIINIANNDLKKYYKDKNIQIISLGFFIYQILNLTEVYLNPIILLLLIFAVFGDRFVISNNEVAEK